MLPMSDNNNIIMATVVIITAIIPTAIDLGQPLTEPGSAQPLSVIVSSFYRVQQGATEDLPKRPS